MNCKQIQEFVMTDYMDGELNEDLRNQIEGHLSSCAKCARFAAALKNNVITPLRQSEPFSPAPSVWMNIKERLENKEHESVPWGWERLRDFLLGLVPIRRPALAFASASGICVIIFILFVLFPIWQKEQRMSRYLQEQFEFLVPSNTNGDVAYYDIRLGTSIEEVFL